MSAYNNSWEQALRYEPTPVNDEIDPSIAAALSRALSSERGSFNAPEHEKTLSDADKVRILAQSIHAMRSVEALEATPYHGSSDKVAEYEGAIALNASKMTESLQQEEAKQHLNNQAA